MRHKRCNRSERKTEKLMENSFDRDDAASQLPPVSSLLSQLPQKVWRLIFSCLYWIFTMLLQRHCFVAFCVHAQLSVNLEKQAQIMFVNPLHPLKETCRLRKWKQNIIWHRVYISQCCCISLLSQNLTTLNVDASWKTPLLVFICV